MARIKSKILGKISGSLGDLSMRNRKGTNYIAMKPGSFNKPTDQDSVNRRAKFAQAVKLASVINGNDLLSNLWQRLTPAEMSTSNFIMQTNYKLMDPEGLSNLNTLVPLNGFPVSVKTFTLGSGKIDITVNPLNNAARFNLDEEKILNLTLVIHLSQPALRSMPEIFFISNENVSVNLVLDQEINFIYNLTEQEVDMIGKYGNVKTYFALITTGDLNIPVNYSQTIVR